jgi:hypothetical protein
MGCDITSYAETRGPDGTWSAVGDVFPLDEYDREVEGKDHGPHPFDWRSYSLFAWLAGVRNYSAITPLAEPRGLPGDLSPEVRKEADDDIEFGSFGWSWFTLAELLAVDYGAEVNDRRVTRNGDGGCTDESGEGERMPLREFLGADYFARLGDLTRLGNPEDVRVVFWFDN